MPRLSLFDALIALLVFAAASIAEALLGETTRPAAVHALIAAPAMAALAWRRHYPLGIAALVVLANFAINPDGDLRRCSRSCSSPTRSVPRPTRRATASGSG